MINVLLLCGGDGSEHQISLISAEFLESKLKTIKDFNVLTAVIHNHCFMVNEKEAFFDQNKAFVFTDNSGKPVAIKVDCVIPCLHGFPGETGDIQSFLEILGIPYIGCGSEASRNCFNKITTKLYLNALGIPNTPFVIISDQSEASRQKALAFFAVCGDVYVKAACQGSSIGCYHVTEKRELWKTVVKAFNYSEEVIIEKTIKHRELEVAAYELDGKLIVTKPGEIIMPDNVFYTFDEKYSANSGTITVTEAKNLSNTELETIENYARRAFLGLKLRDLSRIDFFLSEKDGVLINEINTFPGATPISMFPKMLEHHGDSIEYFLKGAVLRAVASK